MENITVSSDKYEVFLALRPTLLAVAYQMLGNRADAEDMVQECFLRWKEADESKVRSARAFLTTIITRLCLKFLQSARSQREESFGAALPEHLEVSQAGSADAHTQLADSLSAAFLVMLKALSPLERAVFLLREVFECEYEEIGGIVGKSEDNCRQILSRARERVASRQPRFEIEAQHQEQILQRFLHATAQDNLSELLELLSDDATLVCDGSNLGLGPISVQGRCPVTEVFREQASRWLGQGALLETLCFQGSPGILVFRNGLPISSIFLSARNGEIHSVSVITCPVRLRSLLVQRKFGGAKHTSDRHAEN